MDAFLQASSVHSLPPCGPVEVILSHVLLFNCFGYCCCYWASARDPWWCVDGDEVGWARYINKNIYISIYLIFKVLNGIGIILFLPEELVVCNVQKCITHSSQFHFWYAARVRVYAALKTNIWNKPSSLLDSCICASLSRKNSKKCSKPFTLI